MGKYSYRENEEIEHHDSYYYNSTDFQKKWSPIFSPCFGFELSIIENFSLNLENSLDFVYSNEISKIRHTTSYGESILGRNKRIEDYYFKPVNIIIGIYYYF